MHGLLLCFLVCACSYIHVVDLALGHVAAVKKLEEKPGCVAVNLGTGTAYSVLEMLSGVGKACGKELPYKMCPRREGDVAACYCGALQTRAHQPLPDGVAELNLEECLLCSVLCCAIGRLFESPWLHYMVASVTCRPNLRETVPWLGSNEGLRGDVRGSVALAVRQP